MQAGVFCENFNVIFRFIYIIKKNRRDFITANAYLSLMKWGYIKRKYRENWKKKKKLENGKLSIC